jgi:glutamate dehydrogenase/leucine dehydrogenase
MAQSVVTFLMYGVLATSTKEMTDLEAHKAAVETFGSVAQALADLVKVAVGAVIGALSATLQSVLSEKAGEERKASEESKIPNENGRQRKNQVAPGSEDKPQQVDKSAA